MKYNFYLKSPKSKNETTIFIRFSINKKYYKYYTKKKIHPCFWNLDTQRPHTSKKNLAQFKLNALEKLNLKNLEVYLNNLEGHILSYKHQKDFSNSRIEIESFKKYLDEKIFGRVIENPKEITVLDYYQDFVQKIISGKILTNSKKKYKISTIKSYKVSYRRLEKFIGSRTLYFEDVDMNFYNDFVGFLQDLNYAHNSIGTTIKHLKVIMESSLMLGKHNNIIHKDKRFKKFDVVSFQIYLDEQEIEKLENLELPFQSKMDISRDFFLLAYYTGQRFSDTIQISNKVEGDYVRFYTIKGEDEIIVPLSKKAKKILEKYKNDFPRICLDTINTNLKEIGERAGFSGQIEFKEERGGQTILVKKKKYEMLSTHTARRSTVTNLHSKGVNINNIMAISGHKTEKTLNRYIKSSAQDKAILLKELDFFK